MGPKLVDCMGSKNTVVPGFPLEDLRCCSGCHHKSKVGRMGTEGLGGGIMNFAKPSGTSYSSFNSCVPS